MAKPSFFFIAMFIVFGLSFANFDFLYSLNGNASSDTDEYYLFSQPTGIAVSPAGLTYVTDSNRGALYIFNGSVRQKAIMSSSGSNPLSNPMHTDFLSNTLYIADGISGKIKSYAGVGSQIDDWNSGTNIERASSVAFDDTNAYIVDSSKKKVFIYLRSNKAYSRVAIESGDSDGLLSAPSDIQEYGGKFYVSDSAKGVIFAYDSNFTLVSTIGRGKGGVTLASPQGFAIYDDRIYVADKGAARVVAFSLDGYPVDMLNSSVFEGNLSYPEDVEAYGGNLYVADSGNRIIKVFRINETQGDASVLQSITSAQSALFSLQQTQATAALLSIPVQSTQSFAINLASAQDYYDKHVFSSASSLAQGVIASVSAEQSALDTSIDFKVRQLVKSAQDKLAPYRQYASGDIISEVVSFDNKAAVSLSKLPSKSYSESAGIALALGPIAESISKRISEKATTEQERNANYTKALLISRISAYELRLSDIDLDAAAYRQTANTSNAHSLLVTAKGHVSGNDFSSANHSLELVDIEITSFENALARKSSDIKAALQAITVNELEFNSTLLQKTLFPLDLSSQKKTMQQAYDLAYSNPSMAIAMSKQAKEDASLRMRDSQTISLAATATISIVGLIIVLAAAFFIYIKRMKKRNSL